MKKKSPPKTWKSVESEIAEMFGTKRNPLSGANNKDDHGKPRPSDVLKPPPNSIVEVKYRKQIASIKRAMDTKETAKKHDKKFFLHFERMRGDKNTWLLVTDLEVMKPIINFLRRHLKYIERKK